MYFIRYITLAVLSTLLFSTAVEAKALDSLTNEQKEIYISLQNKFQTYITSHQEIFNEVSDLKKKFISDHQLQFNHIIELEQQFKNENKENIEKLNNAREKFKENHPDAILGPKNFLFKDGGTTEDKYNIIYSKLEHHSQDVGHHSHMKIKTELQKKFFKSNKQTILDLKDAHDTFMKEHKNELKQLQDDYNNFYNENSSSIDKLNQLKEAFLKENKVEIEQLGSSAPMFFHEIGIYKKFKY